MTSATTFFDKGRLYLLDGTISLLADTIKVVLLASTYAPRPGAAGWGPAGIYAAGTIIVNGGIYQEALTAGVSSGALPLFGTTRGATTVDNTVTWYCWGYAPPSTHDRLADVSANEISATGYTAGGATLSGKALAQTLHGASFQASPAAWPGSVITARYAAVYKSGTANGIVNPVLFYILLDDTNIDVSVPVEAAFTLSWPSAAGLFTFG